MEITYVGQSCFKIKTKETTIVIYPYNPTYTGIKLPKLESDILLISHSHEDHNYVEGVSGFSHMINSAGESEISGIFITSINTFHDEERGATRGKNLIFSIEFEDMALLHLGDLGHELSDNVIEKLPSIDILLIPVGGEYTINSKVASKIISSLEPKLVIPMHYKHNQAKEISEKLSTVDAFLDEMGGEVEKVDKLKVSKRDLPEDTKVLVLLPQN